MALDTAFYLVTRDIAIRSGLKDSRYRIADGRFVLDNKDLSRVRFTTDEYISGLQGVEKTNEETARTLIAQNGFVMGDNILILNETQTEEMPEEQEVNENTENDVEQTNEQEE